MYKYCWIFFFYFSQCYAEDSQSGTSSKEIENGNAANWELRSFGEILDPERLPDKVEEKFAFKFNLNLTTAFYSIAGQHQDALRLCRVQLKAAKNKEDQQSALSCEKSQLFNLERFREAEELAYSDSALMPDADGTIDDIYKWQFLAALNENQGQIYTAESINKKIIQLVNAARSQQNSSDLKTDLEKSIQSTNLNNLVNIEQSSRSFFIQNAFNQQDFEKYFELVREHMAYVQYVDPTYTKFQDVTLEYAVQLDTIGQHEWAKAIATQVFPAIKAGAGFKEQHEPISNFTLLEAVTLVLGDERVNPIHVRSWVRLGQCYKILGRTQEAERILSEAWKLAQGYLLEPRNSSKLIAEVEMAQSKLLTMKGDLPAAILLLQQAKSRIKQSKLTNRSELLGRRHLKIDDNLLIVDSELLKLITAMNTNKIVDPKLTSEILDILNDFSQSRASVNTNYANNSNDRVDKLIDSEGRLIDSLINQRGRLSEYLSKKIETEKSKERVAQIQKDINEIYEKLAIIKQQLTNQEASSKNAKLNWDGLKQQLGSSTTFFQWIFHPNANIVVCITSQGMKLANISMPVDSIKELINETSGSVNLRKVNKIKDLKPYAVEQSNNIYNILFKNLDDDLALTKHIVLATSPILDHVPWAALATKIYPGDKRSWLIEKSSISMTPSWKSWVYVKERPKSKAKYDLLAVGDPLNIPDSLTGLKKRGGYVSKLLPQPLKIEPQSSAFSKEVDAISKLFPSNKSKLLLREKANKKILLGLPLHEYRLIVFSTHGYLGKEFSNTIGPSLLLSSSTKEITDHFLTAEEISKIKLDANLVVLSACDTSGSDGYLDSEGYSGLTSSFLLSGARNVIATHWPVETEATKFIVTKTLKYYENNSQKNIADALRNATLEYIKSTKNSVYNHPSFWAAFSTIGQ